MTTSTKSCTRHKTSLVARRSPKVLVPTEIKKGCDMSGKHKSSPKTLYGRATAVVFNPAGEVLLVKHNRQNKWALPGGRAYAGEDLGHRAALEVAEETGIQVKDIQFVGRYAGTVASHTVYTAIANGEPMPNPREIQDAVWWDRRRPLSLQQHVQPILALSGEPSLGG